MCRAFEEVRDEALERGRKEGKAEGIAEGILVNQLKSIQSLMETLKVSAQQAMDILKISAEERDAISAKLSSM